MKADEATIKQAQMTKLYAWLNRTRSEREVRKALIRERERVRLGGEYVIKKVPHAA